MLMRRAVPPTARLDAAVYRAYWNGLRVRVGVHTGLCDIRHDEVTKGYDYYGGTANTASRTESIANGGQVLLTGAAYLALSTAEREQLDVTALGGVPLRGVPAPVETYQLNAVPGRTFAALRLDRQDVFVHNEGDGASSSEPGSSVSYMSGPASFSNLVLVTVFGAFTPQQRLLVLKPYCERWSVRLPPRASSVSDDEYCRLLLSRLSLKLEKVMQRMGCAHEAHSRSSATDRVNLPSFLEGLSSCGEDQGSGFVSRGLGTYPELGSVEGGGDDSDYVTLVVKR
ncbi:putative receptor-type adenylate cyclase [Trypanosoma grayi]|uniref:putative receptor-type adenylate cyclase n=1 Tax=Trypanosoma grayi TaxID=71804 RepID=UPI0004F465BD|nr:putative receptor-type adenylate cyclase [Trypanosoma grayi]KEG07812.1 putative receptor-type adenylate cyclase [Trypanosoma grayi]